ncbi:non-specific serine/threonine protein kinase [Ranunculus cassubicifolius]
MALLLRKKRKGSEVVDESDDQPEVLRSTRKSRSEIGSHLSLDHLSFERCTRLRKKCKEKMDADTSVDDDGTFRGRVVGVATAPPFGSSLSDLHGRGVKRKIGCIDAATRIGRKKKLEQVYVLGEEIGKGRFGSVRLCRSKANKEEFACKNLCKGEETVHREAVYEDTDQFHLVMELCSGGRLVDQMAKEGSFSECRAASILKELMLVIKYLHEMGVVHRDIKPENILLTQTGSMKLADFGLATRVSNGQRLSGVVGSPAYVAPEVLVGNYSEKVDIWSAGVLLHALLTGTLPFKGDSLEAVFEAIKKVNLNLTGGVWESVSAPARDLLGRMLTRDVTLRATADEVLRHPWIIFHTEEILKTTSIKSKGRSHARVLSCEHISIPQVESLNIKVASVSLNAHSRSKTTCGYGSDLEEEQNNCSFVDALAAAISRVTISAPKRSRLCGPTTPIQKDCSPTVKTNSLCTAF